MTEKFRSVVEKWYYKIYLIDEVFIDEAQKSKYITDDMTPYILGADSLDEAELIINLESAYEISITDIEKWNKGFTHMKFKDMCDWVENKPKR